MRKFGRFLGDVWSLATPYFRSEEKWSAWALLLVVLGANFLLVRIAVVSNLNQGAWLNSMQQYDEAAFFRLLLTYVPDPDGPFGIIPGFIPLIAAQIVIVANGRYLHQWLAIRWRRWLTQRYQAGWLANRAYYQMQLQPETLGNDNPDQRISEDVRDFVENGLTLGLGFFSNLVSVVSFLQVLWVLSSPFAITLLGIHIPVYLVWVAIIYSVAASLLAHLIGRPLISLNYIRQRLEADFRFALVRLRENAEGVALHGGEADEGRILGGRFGAIVANYRRIMARNRLVYAFSFFIAGVGGIFPYFAAAPLYFSKAISFGVLGRVADAFTQLQSSASWLVDNYLALADWAATVERLATFSRSLDAARANRSGITVVAAKGAEYVGRDLHLALPDGTVLLDGVTLRLAPGSHTALRGRSGVGKSTLFRALAGVWPFGQGVVERPAGRTMFLPQRPYIPLGSLRRAVTYPAAIDAYSAEQVGAALADAGLGGLVAELDADLNWGQRLSGGEQQRLALARALLNRPDWLFLDEATANLDPQGEAEMYRVLRERLPGTAVMSIAHRPEIAALHEEVLTLRRGEESKAGALPQTPPEDGRPLDTFL